MHYSSLKTRFLQDLEDCQQLSLAITATAHYQQFHWLTKGMFIMNSRDPLYDLTGPVMESQVPFQEPHLHS